MSNLSPIDLSQATRLIHLQLLPPSDGSEGKVTIAVGIKGDPPLVCDVLRSELVLPPLLESLLAQLEAEIPQRSLAREKRQQSQTEAIHQRNSPKRQVSVPAPVTEPSTASITQPSLF